MKQAVAALALSTCMTYLAGCAGGASVVGLSPAWQQRAAFSYESLYSFAGGADGNGPEAALLNVNGTLFGTTYSGGGTGCFMRGCGTVFEVSASGLEHVLYSFQGGTDGNDPLAAVTNVGGTLYGTTVAGGGSGCYNGTGCGTIFEVLPSGTEQVIHSFQGPPDGQRPYAGLIDLSGTLYGTTGYGGTGACKYIDEMGCGTVFAISDGVERIVYSFKGGKDGLDPYGSVIHVKGTLYGTTSQGGASGNGTVFEVSTAGVARVLYSFKGGKDGSGPLGSLVNVKGMLYGATSAGGGSGCSMSGCGTIFTVSTSGAEHVLYRFKGGRDGAYPYAGLVNFDGTLYGTTFFGGRLGCSASCGTIFKVSTSGAEQVLYRFQGTPDGENSTAGLVQVGGALYGTTLSGGSLCSAGCGTVFEVTP